MTSALLVPAALDVVVAFRKVCLGHVILGTRVAC